MDIDIDFDNPEKVKKLFADKIVIASRVEDNELKKHNVGTYIQNIPKDKVTGLAAIPCMITNEKPKRDRAEELGYYKFDFLKASLLERVESKEELDRLIKTEPDWSLLEEPNFVKNLWHIGNHFDVVFQVKPKSILELADVMALIRPGKRGLLDKYLRDPEGIRTELYTKRAPEDMRKSHCLPYAMLIVVNMHLDKRDMENENSTGNN
jgi:hypothetical protein